MKKVLKLFKKGLMYFAAFIAVVIFTAGIKIGLFYINRSDDDPSSPELDNVCLTKVVEGMLSADNANFNLDLQLQSETNNPISISSNIFINMKESSSTELMSYKRKTNSGASQLKLNLNGYITFNGQNIHYEINYLNGFIYAKLGDAQVKIQTNNMTSDLNTILDYAVLKKFGVNLSLPDLSQFNLSPELLSGLANQLTETDTDSGKEIKFNLMGYGWATILTDKDYALKSIKLEELNFNGTKITADVQADLKPEPQKIVEPENKEDMTDLSGLTKFLGMVDKLADKGVVKGEAQLNLLNKKFTAEYSVNFTDFNNISAHVKTKLANNIIEVVYQNHNIYISYDECKYYIPSPFDFSEIIDAINFYCNKFGIDLNSQEIKSLIDSVNIKDLSEALNKISNLKVDETGLNYKYNDLELKITTLNEEFEKIIVSFKNLINLEISLSGDVQIPTINENAYKNILDENLFRLLHKQIIKDKKVSLKANIEVNGMKVEASLKSDFTDKTKVQITVKVFDRFINLYFVDDMVYLELDNMLKAKGTISELVQFIKSSNLLELKNDVIDFETIRTLLLSGFDNKDLELNLVKANGNVEVLEIKDKKINCKITSVEYQDFSYEENGTYQNLVDIGNFAKTLLDSIQNKDLAFDVNLNYSNYEVTGKFQYIDNKFSAKFSTVLFEKNIEVEIENDLVFVNFAGLKFSSKLSDLSEIVDFIKDKTEINFGEINELIDIDNLLNNTSITYTNKYLNIACKDMLFKVDVENLEVLIQANNLTGTVNLSSPFVVSEKTDYLDFSNLKDLFKATINTLKNLELSGQMNVNLNLFNEVNTLIIDYAIQLKDKQLVASISTNFKGLNVDALIIDKNIYLNIVGYKMSLSLDELPDILDWVNSSFNVKIPSEIKDIINVDKIKETDFDIIKSISASSNEANIEFKNSTLLTINFNDFINKVKFDIKNNSVVINCTNFEDVNIEEINEAEYKHYKNLTNLIDTVLSLVKSKQYNISAKVEKFKDNNIDKTINANLELDVTSNLNAYLNILGLNQDILIGYDNKMLYFCYGGENGMKFSIQENALQEILAILCNALNIDVSSIKVLDDFIKKENLDTSNLETLIPKIEMSNPLKYLEYIESINITDNCFEIDLKAEKLGQYALNKNIGIMINYSNDKIENIIISNLHINSEQNEYFNIQISLNEFEGVSVVQQKEEYIDISGAKDLLRAFVNTSNLNDWHIVGKVQLSVKLGSLKMNAATLDVDIKVKLDENKKPIIACEITNYPLVGGVNNRNTNGVGAVGVLERHRSISVYYKNGEIYLKTVDAKYGAYKELTRVTKIAPKILVDNLSYYLQYLLGFTDSIQSKIDEAIQKTQSYEGSTNYGKIIEGFTSENNKHTIIVNLTELTHNSDIGTLTLILTTNNDSSTNNKDFIHRVDLNLTLLDEMLSLKTDSSSNSDGLYLTDIGSSVDLSKANECFELFDSNGFNLDGEYQKQGSNSWKKDNTGTSELTFISLNKVIQTSSGEVASKINFPIMSNYTLDDGITFEEYQFYGWYYDEDFTNEFTLDSYPRYNTTLFAKWTKILSKLHAKIILNTNQNGLVLDNLTGFVGENFVLPTCQNIVENIDDNTTILKTFLGWFTESGEKFTGECFTEQVLNLYAHWDIKETKTYSLKIINANVTVYENKVEANSLFDLTLLACFNETTLVYTSNDFADSNLVDNFYITQNTTWYLRNKYTVVIHSKYTTLNGEEHYKEYELYEGTTIDLPQYNTFEKNNNSYTSEFKFNGYKLNNSVITDKQIKTLSSDCILEADWKEVQWCVVTFDVCWARPSGWVNDGKQNSISSVSNTNGTNTIRIEKDTNLNFSDFVATACYKYGIKYNFKTVAWGDTAKNVNVGSYNGASYLTITSNCTLKPIWKAC